MAQITDPKFAELLAEIEIRNINTSFPEYHKLTATEYFDILNINAEFFNLTLEQMTNLFPFEKNTSADMNRFIEVVNSQYLKGRGLGYY